QGLARRRAAGCRQRGADEGVTGHGSEKALAAGKGMGAARVGGHARGVGPPRRDPPIYSKIRQKARELYPEGYDHEKTNVLVDGVSRAPGKDAPFLRSVTERALGRRRKR